DGGRALRLGHRSLVQVHDPGAALRSAGSLRLGSPASSLLLRHSDFPSARRGSLALTSPFRSARSGRDLPSSSANHSHTCPGSSTPVALRRRPPGLPPYASRRRVAFRVSGPVGGHHFLISEPAPRPACPLSTLRATDCSDDPQDSLLAGGPALARRDLNPQGCSTRFQSSEGITWHPPGRSLLGAPKMRGGRTLVSRVVRRCPSRARVGARYQPSHGSAPSAPRRPISLSSLLLD